MTWQFVEFGLEYDRTKFDCGEPALNDYLKRYISRDVERRANVPVLAINHSQEVIGFYNLSNGAVEFKNFPPELKRKIAPYPVPVARIGRLAVDSSIKGRGLGRELLFHAIDRVEGIAEKIGIRAIVVDAKNENAEKFYLHYGFQYLQDQGPPRKSLFLIL